MTEEQINMAIARVLISTKRKSRKYSLYEIANDICLLKKELGGITPVAKIIGLSVGMLNQFLSVFKLPKQIIELVKQRKIESVSLVSALSKLDESDILALEDLLLKNQINSQELRVLLPYRKQHLNEPITELLKKVIASKNIKVSVIRLGKEDIVKTIEEINNLISTKVGVTNIIEIGINGEYIDIKLTKEGERILRNDAKLNHISFQQLIVKIVS